MEQDVAQDEIRSIFSKIEAHAAIQYKNPFSRSSPRDKWLMGASLVLFLIGALLAGINQLGMGSAGLRWSALVLLLCAILGSIAFQMLMTIRSVSALLQPRKEIVRIAMPKAERDFEFAYNLQTHSQPIINFAIKRLRLTADQTRGRIGMLVGAIDKTGILPLAVTWLFACWKFIENKNVPTNYSELAAGIFGGIYVGSIALMGATYRIDELAQAIESAALLDRTEKVQSAAAAGTTAN